MRDGNFRNATETKIVCLSRYKPTATTKGIWRLNLGNHNFKVVRCGDKVAANLGYSLI